MGAAFARDIVYQSLEELGITAAGETPSAEDAQYALIRLTRFMNLMQAQRLAIYKLTRTVWTLVSGTAAYTVGTGGTVNVVRPVYINEVRFIDTSPTPTNELPLQALTDDQYASIVQKTLTNTYPSCWYYNPTFPLGSLTFWPVPTSATLQGVLYAPSAIQEFTALGDAVSIPPGYEEFIVTQLALRLAPGFRVQPSQTLMATANAAKSTIEAVNLRLVDLALDSAVLQSDAGMSTYDIRFG